MRLYKDRYLLAKYDLQDRLIAVGTTPEELGYKSEYDINHAIKRFDKYENCRERLFMIDCLEKHDDCFKEEDEIFLEMFEKQTKNKTIKEYAKKHGMGERTIYRWLGKNKLTYNNENGEIYEKEL